MAVTGAKVLTDSHVALIFQTSVISEKSPFYFSLN